MIILKRNFTRHNSYFYTTTFSEGGKKGLILILILISILRKKNKEKTKKIYITGPKLNFLHLNPFML